jgi:RNA polymerase II-associated factor 1
MQPLPAKIVSRKKRAKEGRSSDEVEHFPVPSRVTVRRRSAVAAVELRDPEVRPWSSLLIKAAVLDFCYSIPLIWLWFQVYSNSKGSSSNSKRGGLDIEDGLGRPQKVARHNDIDQYSGEEDEMSDWFSSNPNDAALKWSFENVLAGGLVADCFV